MGPVGRALGPRSARNMMARQQQQQRGTTEEVKTLVVIESEVRKKQPQDEIMISDEYQVPQTMR